MTFFIFFTAAANAGVVAADFWKFAHYGCGLFVMMAVALTGLMGVGVAINKKPLAFVGFSELGGLMMIEGFAFGFVGGDELNGSLFIIGLSFFSGKNLKSHPFCL